MIAYLDTNVVVWLAGGDLNRISRTAQEVIETADLLISPMVLLELEYLYEVGRTRLPARDVYLKIENEIGVGVCDQAFAAVTDAALGERWTRDPFDRIVVAQAKANGLARLLSADEEIRRHYVRTLW